jgi:hypothetical protein
LLTVNFTNEEVKALITQIGARLDDLKAIQKQEAKKENISRVIEIEKFMEPIKSGYQKLIDA